MCSTIAILSLSHWEKVKLLHWWNGNKLDLTVHLCSSYFMATHFQSLPPTLSWRKVNKWTISTFFHWLIPDEEKKTIKSPFPFPSRLFPRIFWQRTLTISRGLASFPVSEELVRKRSTFPREECGWKWEENCKTEQEVEWKPEKNRKRRENGREFVCVIKERYGEV